MTKAGLWGTRFIADILAPFCTVRPGQTEALRDPDAPIPKLGRCRLTRWADCGLSTGQLIPPTSICPRIAISLP